MSLNIWVEKGCIRLFTLSTAILIRCYSVNTAGTVKAYWKFLKFQADGVISIALTTWTWEIKSCNIALKAGDGWILSGKRLPLFAKVLQIYSYAFNFLWVTSSLSSLSLFLSLSLAHAVALHIPPPSLPQTSLSSISRSVSVSHINLV